MLKKYKAVLKPFLIYDGILALLLMAFKIIIACSNVGEDYTIFF